MVWRVSLYWGDKDGFSISVDDCIDGIVGSGNVD